MSKPSTTALRLVSHARLSRVRSIRCRSRLPAPQTSLAVRQYSSILNELDEENQKKGFKIYHLFGGLVGLGMLVTIYGLLEYYFSLNTWPPAIRTPLRAALKARNAGDYDRSEKYFREAINVTLSMSPADLEPGPLLKLTGIYVEFAALLESQGQVVKAYLELLKAQELLAGIERPDTSDIASSSSGSTSWANSDRPESREEKVRAIGLLQKIGHLSLQVASMPSPPLFPTTSTSSSKKLKSWDASAEYYLNEAMSELLAFGKNDKTSSSNLVNKLDLPRSSAESTGGGVNIKGFGITMEALAEVYARKGDFAGATGCLLQAVDSLVPPKKEGAVTNPSTSDICQAAMLMTTISSYLSHPRTTESNKQSRSFALQSLQMSDQALTESRSKSPLTDPELAICQRAKTVGLFNMGMLAEMQSDLPNAIKYFTKSLGVARETGFSEGKRQANEAIRRVKGLGGASL